MTRILDIAKAGSSFLKTKTSPMNIEAIGSPVVRLLIADMTATYQYFGMSGIAAPQVRVCERVAIVETSPTKNSDSPEHPAPLVMFNLRIDRRSKELQEGWERSTSLPGLRALVLRPWNIEVEFISDNGELNVRTFEGPLARKIHRVAGILDGRTFLEDATLRSITTEEEFQRSLSRRSADPMI